MKLRVLGVALLEFVTACSRPEPIIVQRLVSPNGDAEISLWHQEAAGTLDSTMLFSINKPNASFSSESLKAGIKRGRDVVSYWSSDGEPMLVVRDFDGWTRSDENSPSLTICGFSLKDCVSAAPPSSTRRIILGTYHSGESEGFAVAR